MLKHSELIKSPEYWMVSIQHEIYYALVKTGKPNDVLANEIGVSRRIVRRCMNGDFNGTLEDFVKIALYLGKWPLPEGQLPQNKES